jgi:phenylalanyl-tRNA synthetase beta chain
MKELGGEFLQEVRVFDVYQHAEMVQQGRKSVSFRLVFQSFTRTLETAEVEKITKQLGGKIEKLFQVKLRDK